MNNKTIDPKTAECRRQRNLKTRPIEGTVCEFFRQTEDYETLAQIFNGQGKRTPTHTDLVTRMTLREANIGKRGFFFSKTSGKDPTHTDREENEGEQLGGYYIATHASALGCSGFLLLPNDKWLPVLLEEIEISIEVSERDSRILEDLRLKVGTFANMNSVISTNTIAT